MDELAASLEASFQVTTYPNNPASVHPRFSEYKVKTPGSGDQEVRRKKHLENQKEKRLDYLMLVRRLGDGDWKDAEDEEEDEAQMEVQESPSKGQSVSGTGGKRYHYQRPGRYYKNQLMLSEWMIFKPEDFETHWLMVPCPVGKRSLIVASRGMTRVFSKNGFLCNTFQSLLPGGNSNSRVKRTVMDGIYREAEKTYYILDLMCWGDHPIYDSETEFRRFFLEAKLNETTGINQIGSHNKCKIVNLPQIVCTKENISNALNAPPAFELDGLLFYHKQAHYYFGPTPLVLWLKAYMVPEILRAEVSGNLMSKKPESYTTFSDHVVKVLTVKEEVAKKSPNRGSPRRGHRRHSRGSSRSVPESPETTPGKDNVEAMETSAPRGRSENFRNARKGRGRSRGSPRGTGITRKDFNPIVGSPPKPDSMDVEHSIAGDKKESVEEPKNP